MKRRRSSVVSRLNASYFWRWLRSLLVLDLILFSLCTAIYLVRTEEEQLADQWQPWLERRIERDESRAKVWGLPSLLYRFRLPKAASFHELPLRPYMQTVGFVSLLLGACELNFLFINHLHGRKRSARLLEPLEDMAEQAEKLARQQPRLENLEAAIERIKPSLAEAKLSTGQRELQGLENAVNHLLERLRASQQEQLRFVSDASHELRTPIAVIQGYADLLARWGQEDPVVAAEAITAIQNEAQGMQRLVEQLLFLARGDQGRQTFNFQMLNLSALIREVVEDFKLIHPEQNWLCELEAGDVSLQADPRLIKQVLRILGDNAAKFTPAGGSIHYSLRENIRGELEISVRDEGCGMAPEEAPRIFERFYRSDPARSRNSGGSGLGLAIAKWIVDGHGGYFRVLSRPGLGTRMTICLPKGERFSEL